MPKKNFSKSIPTGLTKGSKIRLGQSTDSPTYVVVSDSIQGRSSWDGYREWDKQTGKGSWKETLGQQGAKSGTLQVQRYPTSQNLDEIKAKFDLSWKPAAEVTTRSCGKKTASGTIRPTGKQKVIQWGMKVVLSMTIQGVKYLKVMDTFPITETKCDCK